MFIACVSLLLIIFWLFKNDLRKIYLAWNIPGPKALPIIGNGLDLVNKSPTEFIEISKGYLRDHGRYFRIWLANQLVIIMNDPKHVQVILTDVKLITKAEEYKYLKPWLNTGLLISTNQKWMQRRKILTPAFHFKILEEFIEVFDKQGSVLVEKLKKFDGKEAFDVFPSAALCGLDVICETAMGISLNSQNDVESQYVKNVNELSDIMHRRTYDLISRYDISFKFTKTYQRQKELLKDLHSFTDNVITSRRNELKNAKNEDEDVSEIGLKKKRALLDLLLATKIEGKPLSDMDIREEIDTFMFAGHDTFASALSYTLYNIAKHENVQRKCYEEIKNILGRDEKITPKSLNEMKYLELVIKETLRLYPSVPMFARKVPEEMTINGILLPKDTTIIISPYFIARDSHFWNEPEKFIPERFAAEKVNEDSQIFSYIPFSGGYRNCIGQKFAMMEIKSVLSKIVLNYKLTLPENFEPQDAFEIVIKSKNGIMISVKRRN